MSSTKKNSTSKILVGKCCWNKCLKYYEEEEPGNAKHGKRLYKPVGDTGYQYSFRTLTDVPDTLEIHLEHHGINHQPYQDSDRDGYIGILPFTQCLRYSGDPLTDGNTGNYAKRNPYCKVSLKKSYPFVFLTPFKFFL